MQRKHPESPPPITVEIRIKSTKMKFATLRVTPQWTVGLLKFAIVDKHRRILAKWLNLPEERCIPRIVLLYKDGQELKCRSQKKLRNLGLKEGRSYTLEASFSRVLGFMTVSKLNHQIERLGEWFDPQISREMRQMALNMATNATYNEARFILHAKKAEVFETIILSESPQVVAQAKGIRRTPNYPMLRVRYQI